MKKYLFAIPVILILLFGSAAHVSAEVLVAGTSAQIKRDSAQTNVDLRVYYLREYLSERKSPLIGQAEDFITYSDLYGIDWRLVPAISGVESGFAKHMPKNSYNAYGWANGNYRFASWENSIETVSKTLREKYYDKGATNIGKIARRYAPPSNTWGNNVKFFMKKIDPIPVQFDL